MNQEKTQSKIRLYYPLYFPTTVGNRSVRINGRESSEPLFSRDVEFLALGGVGQDCSTRNESRKSDLLSCTLPRFPWFQLAYRWWLKEKSRFEIRVHQAIISRIRWPPVLPSFVSEDEEQPIPFSRSPLSKGIASVKIPKYCCTRGPLSRSRTAR